MARAQSVSLSYIYFSSYFILNSLCLLVYPVCRIFFNFEATATTINEDNVSSLAQLCFFGRLDLLH